MTKEKLAELARLAEAATPGPYWTYNGTGLFTKGKEGLSLVDEAGESDADTLKYLAAANPEAVLGLISRIEKLEAALQFYADIGTYGTAGPGDCTSVDSSDCEPVLIDGWGESYRPGKRAREALTTNVDERGES